MRGIGPKVVISFDACEESAATALKGQLAARGCRAMLEIPPAAEGPRTLAEVEVFVQLRSVRSRSDQLDRRFKDAAERRARDPDFVLIPIAIDGTTSSGGYDDWAYIDAGADGLSASVVEQTARLALSAVHPLPLATTNFLTFEPAAIAGAFERACADRKRVVCDPDGFLLEDGWIVMDATVRRLLEALHRHLSDFSPYDRDRVACAQTSIDRFSRLALWPLLQSAGARSNHLEHGRRNRLCAAATEVRAQASALSSSTEIDRIAAWALGTRRWDKCRDFIEVRAWGPATPPMTWYLPRTIFGRYWRESLTIGCKPSGEISQGDWIDFVLPQIALHAYQDRRLGSDVAWTLDEYTDMRLA